MTPSPTAVSAPNLASCYQEILTVTARLRTRKFAVGDSAVFRTEVRKALALAEDSGHSLGYQPDDIRLAAYAVVSLLDETIFFSSNPAFRDWANKPLMLDLYGTGNAGDGFFENMSAILNRRETKQTIDLLEVYVLCLMLGFRGRYNAGSGEQLHSRHAPAIEKILRYRGGGPLQLSPSWLPEAGIDLPLPSNRVTRMVISGAAATLAACGILWAGYSYLLNRGLTDLGSFLHR